MSVEAILRTKGSDVATIAPTATTMVAARTMKERKIGALVVVDEGKILGIITERDVVNAVVERGGGALGDNVAAVMRANVVSCTRKDSLKAIMEKMTVHRTRHLPVIEDGALVGMVSIGDAVKKRLEEAELEAGVLRDAYIARG
jgi:CBS domain-containing protein